MENKKGYVYVLMNPSYDGLVKVGKTTKEPEERAKELSASTGVATPFIVVYKKIFQNCHIAEKTIHSILTERGCRVNDSREFFSISISEVIDVILQLPDEEPFEEENIFYQEEQSEDEENLGELYYNIGEKYHNGTDDTFQDYDMALYYYEKSASLGHLEANEKIGDIWVEKENTKKALRYYTKAAVEYEKCYAKIGEIYMNKYGADYHKRNAILAWKKFFEYLERHKDSLLIKSDFCGWYIGFHLENYFSNYLLVDGIPKEHEEFIVKNKWGIIGVFLALEEMYEQIHTNKNSYYTVNEIRDEILPYLYSLEDSSLISDIEKDSDLSKLNIAHHYLKNYDSDEQNIEIALKIYNECAEEGCIEGYAYIGICHYLKNQFEKADKFWKMFYNNVYDLLQTEELAIITSEQKQSLVEAFYQMLFCTIDSDDITLIHKYYIIAAIKLGIIEYSQKNLELLSERLTALQESIENDTAHPADYNQMLLYTRKLSLIHKKLLEVVAEIQSSESKKGKYNIMLYPLEW